MVLALRGVIQLNEVGNWLKAKIMGDIGCERGFEVSPDFESEGA